MDDQAAIVEALGIAVAARVPVLLWGAPGTGKTSAIRALAAAAGLPCETVIASIREPSDFAGLPIVNRAAGSVAEGFSSGWPTPPPPAMDEDWERRAPITRSWIAGFLTVRPKLAVAVPEDPAAAGRAWPSPRTWDMAARLQAAAEAARAG